MPDPRLTGTHRLGAEPQRNLTFRVDGTSIAYEPNAPNGTSKQGLAVMLASAGVVGLATDGALVLGQLMLVEADGACDVITEGVLLLPAGDAGAAAGGRVVGALKGTDPGYVRAAVAATAADLLAARGVVLSLQPGGAPADTVEVLLT